MQHTQNTATLVKDNLAGATGHAALYRLTPPIKSHHWDCEKGQQCHPECSTHKYVRVSATMIGFGTETYLFPADSSGKVADWGELRGSMKDTLSHVDALNAAGYEVTS